MNCLFCCGRNEEYANLDNIEDTPPRPSLCSFLNEFVQTPSGFAIASGTTYMLVGAGLLAAAWIPGANIAALNYGFRYVSGVGALQGVGGAVARVVHHYRQN